jgi:alpha-beta hydrolase superfamily lysophospholipase
MPHHGASVTPTIIIATLLLLAGLWTAFALRWRATREPDAWVQVTAKDGHPLSLAHFRAQGERRAAEPVLLCHGLSVNRFNMDMDDETSLARWLAARGFDVYVVELRGHGRSKRGLLSFQRFDDYPTLDLPAVIEAVRARHGAAKVHWCGHSMGGLVLYAYLAREPEADVRSAVTIGSPVRMRPAWWMKLGIRAAALWPFPLCWSPGSFLVAPIVGRIDHPLVRMIVNPRNVRGSRMRTALANVVADISPGEVRHFARMACEGSFTSADGACDYAAGLATTTTPCLVIAGTDDRLATPAAVRAGFDALGGGAPHAFRLAGRASGDPEDFGHGDLVIGDHAPGVVFPEVERWLRAHDPALVAV